MRIQHGIDTISILRIERGIIRLGQGFLDRIWTPEEQAYCRARGKGQYESYAVRFAAKEAVAKALGTGLLRNGVSFLSMEVRADDLGSPYVSLSDAALARYEEIGGIDIALSLSHDGDSAQASCVILCAKES